MKTTGSTSTTTRREGSGHQALSTYIEARFDEFSRSQKDVAQYIVDHLDRRAGAEYLAGGLLDLGQGGADQGRFLHNANFDFNDAVIPVGSAMFAALVERSMPLEN
jgi:hypothetical protein